MNPWIFVGVLALFLVVLYAFYDNLQKRQENMRKEFEKLKFRNTDLETQQLVYLFNHYRKWFYLSRGNWYYFCGR